jgi:hypothetical membrane protein
MRWHRRNIAGFMLFIGSAIFLMGMIVSESVRPDHNVSENYISDLGVGKTAPIFNTTISLLGLVTIIGVIILRNDFNSRSFLLLLGLSGIGSLALGLFPSTVPASHMPFAATSLLFGAASAIISFKFIATPFRYGSLALGAVSLSALLFLATGNYLGMGPGGMERLVVYPLIIWALGIGGSLMGALSNRRRWVKGG